MAHGIQNAQSTGFSTSRVFNRAFGTVAANPLAALGITLLFGVLLSEAHAYAYIYAARYIYAEGAPQTVRWYAALTMAKGFSGLVFAALGACLVQGAMVRLTSAHDAAQRPSFADGAGAAARALFPLIVLGLLIGLCTTIGLLALVLPGLLLSVVWAVSAPVLVEERCGVIAALGRSRALTQGARGPILGMVVLLWGLEVGGGLLRGWLYRQLYMGVMEQPPSMLAYHLSLIVTGMILKTCSAALYTSIYVELRNWKHGASEEVLAEIFA